MDRRCRCGASLHYAVCCDFVEFRLIADVIDVITYVSCLKLFVCLCKCDVGVHFQTINNPYRFMCLHIISLLHLFCTIGFAAVREGDSILKDVVRLYDCRKNSE